MKKLAISGYILRYSGEQGLRARLEDIIIKKEACIDEMQSMCGVNHGLSSGHYDESESVTIVGVEAA